ncbi:hypothetical protein Pan161_55290 [Gimesia algae]|uniref:Uncharacterized protein n=1 Tax=Gimesia algae TaxID=2527971 RepID=A0A517VLF0_9PLAN|nr:hypothetical protein Pan161_55290 [Gimesia algae]
MVTLYLPRATFGMLTKPSSVSASLFLDHHKSGPLTRCTPLLELHSLKEICKLNQTKVSDT